jgi:bifunctional non-homologous end joining protein LigD
VSRFILPAQPTLRTTPPTGDGWLHEVKFDGYRAQLHKGETSIVYSKNGKDFSSRFPAILHAVKSLPCKSVIIDAEIVALKEDGTYDFRALHSGNYSQENLCAWCFDVLELNGEDLQPLPLIARRLKLGTLLKRHAHGSMRYSDTFTVPEKLLAECKRLGLEGIVSKKRDQPYRSGKCDWVKVKTQIWRDVNKERGELFNPQKR